MTGRRLSIDPRMFISRPFATCPKCGSPEFGTLMIANNFHARRCRGCSHTERSQLPPIRKRLIYLDQMVLSNVAKELDPVWRTKTRRPDQFWLELFDQIDRLVKLQILVCPKSPVHEEESAYDDRFEVVLRRLYNHLAAGVSLDFPRRINTLQIWEAISAQEEGRDPDWSRITAEDVVDGNLDKWSDRILLTVNMGHWFGELDERRVSRAEGHKALVDVWNRWRAAKGLTFAIQFERERRAFAKVAIDSYLRYLALLHNLNTGAEVPSDPMALMPSDSVMLVKQLAERLADEGDDLAERIDRVTKFLCSEPVLLAPKNHIAALLYAGLARRAVGGKKQPPSRGTANDIDVISAYLPYCDARHAARCAASLAAGTATDRLSPRPEPIPTYPTR